MEIARSIEQDSPQHGAKSIQGLRASSNPASQPIKALIGPNGPFF
jgi:hypothetical protein